MNQGKYSLIFQIYQQWMFNISCTCKILVSQVAEGKKNGNRCLILQYLK